VVGVGVADIAVRGDDEAGRGRGDGEGEGVRTGDCSYILALFLPWPFSFFVPLPPSDSPSSSLPTWTVSAFWTSFPFPFVEDWAAPDRVLVCLEPLDSTVILFTLDDPSEGEDIEPFNGPCRVDDILTSFSSSSSSSSLSPRTIRFSSYASRVFRLAYVRRGGPGLLRVSWGLVVELVGDDENMRN
jgi:hypothetical protein